MRALLMPASFQHIDKAFEFGACIGVWVADRVAHAGLRCKMKSPQRTAAPRTALQSPSDRRDPP